MQLLKKTFRNIVFISTSINSKYNNDWIITVFIIYKIQLKYGNISIYFVNIIYNFICYDVKRINVIGAHTGFFFFNTMRANKKIILHIIIVFFL